LDWVTIPQMAAACFAMIIALSINGLRTPTEELT
jgi:hypothetical protein